MIVGLVVRVVLYIYEKFHISLANGPRVLGEPKYRTYGAIMLVIQIL